MKIAILSTLTKHHTYFINKLHDRFDIQAVVYEQWRLQKDYQTGPFFSEEEDLFELRFFDPDYDGTAPVTPETIEKRMLDIHSVNQPEAVAYLKALDLDVIVLFGVGLVKSDVLSAARLGAINVHRGLTQHHRGLDSDLWAIFESHFDQIGVTIHAVDQDFDTGHILAQEIVPVAAEDAIYHLRYKTTVCATRLVLGVLAEMEATGGQISGTPLAEPGSYYTAMALEDKMLAAKKFKNHVEALTPEIPGS